MINKPGNKVFMLKGTHGKEGERLEDLTPTLKIGARIWHRSFSLFEYLEKTHDGFLRIDRLRHTVKEFDVKEWFENPEMDWGWRLLYNPGEYGETW